MLADIVKNTAYKSAALVTTGLTFVVGMSYNNAIKEIVDDYMPLSKSKGWVLLLYAIVLTILLAIVLLFMPDPPPQKIIVAGFR